MASGAARENGSAFVIGTRGSPLALAQAHETQRRLSEALGIAPERFALDVIKTSGDMIQDRALSEAGGKGLFTKEIDQAQLEGRVDITVHSGKDLPNDLPDGLVIAGFLPREDVRDALICKGGPEGPTSFADLAPGTIVGTASLRRQAMVRRLRPDLEVALLRGNVGTRLSKIEAGEYGATLLAMAGLNRLGLAHHASAALDIDDFLPAVAQGAIAIVVREADALAREAATAICDEETGIRLAAERAFLAVLDGSCRTPIAGHARIVGDRVHLKGLVLRPDGSEVVEGEGEAPLADAARLGAEVGADVKARLPAGIFG
ncbi:hydroxymethylbilane synthase [Salinarimonas ramus]|uniref:Porphobilinogen deaminase n=1 Tax=Salinarimonas ramus TaxID=690164 RepID=A0A917V367_9HYPH|nr:hydroxymethylbilane synthase [Salinarimonas ramus]GGK28595.1 porphobilinogen deaminase [Salinarimonas ramus]